LLEGRRAGIHARAKFSSGERFAPLAIRQAAIAQRVSQPQRRQSIEPRVNAAAQVGRGRGLPGQGGELHRAPTLAEKALHDRSVLRERRHIATLAKGVQAGEYRAQACEHPWLAQPQGRWACQEPRYRGTGAERDAGGVARSQGNRLTVQPQYGRHLG
jgi:hypothetical protein